MFFFPLFHQRIFYFFSFSQSLYWFIKNQKNCSFIIFKMLENINTTTAEPLLPTGLTRTDYILAVVIFTILFGVGISIDRSLMKHVATNKKAFKAAMLGVSLQYLIMPVLAYILTLVFRVESKAVALGFITVGCVPGGATSNVLAKWGSGILELSVFMTICSTILGFGMIPLWMYVYGSEAVGVDSATVDFVSLVIGLALLLVPLLLGLLVGSLVTPETKEKVEKVTVAITVIFIIIAMVLVGLDNSDALFSAEWNVWVPACFYFFIASSLGYAISRNIFGFSPAVCRTIFIEVGLQNTSLAYSLVQLSIRNDVKARGEAIQFPFIYTLFMYVWSLIAIPIMRNEEKKNKAEGSGVEDCEPDFDAVKLAMLLEQEETDRLRFQNEEMKEEKDEEEKEFEKIQIEQSQQQHQEKEDTQDAQSKTGGAVVVNDSIATTSDAGGCLSSSTVVNT